MSKEFTKEEIYLCKQVAEKYRKDIKRGDWYIDLNVADGNLDLCNYNAGVYYRYLNNDEKVIPLWTISDCLEFLREKVSGTHLVALEVSSKEGKDKCACYIFDPSVGDQKEYIFLGKTPLEACLKAVLAVLEEKK